MARSNKYTSLNFNDIYDKQKKPSTSSSSSTTTSTNSTTSSTLKSYSSSHHGGMLVLSRPSPSKPHLPSPPLSPQPQPPPPSLISLRPQGSTGSSPIHTSSFPALDKHSPSPSPSPSPKGNIKFVPPHLRPGFVARDAPQKRPGSGHGNPDRRPNSGGALRNAFDSDRSALDRPRSGTGAGAALGGFRPGSSGWRKTEIYIYLACRVPCMTSGLNRKSREIFWCCDVRSKQKPEVAGPVWMSFYSYWLPVTAFPAFHNYGVGVVERRRERRDEPEP